MISIEELIDLVEYSSTRLKVLTKDESYGYDESYSEETIHYVDSQSLLNALHSIKQQKELNAST